MLNLNKFEHIYIDEKSRNSKVAQRFLELFPQEKISYSLVKPLKNEGQLSAQEFDRSKKIIWITPFEGQFFKRCPGSKPGLACCNYFVLNLGQQCDMNCSYCYLQSYINSPVMTIYSNIEKALGELESLGESSREFALRVGTGEVIDSLSMDPLTLYSHILIDFFKKFPKWNLEFKTKSNHVDQFIDQEHAGNVIVSWSVNPQAIVEREEHQTATLNERLEAARRCLEKGFQVSFHLDPVIYHPEWRDNYFSLVDEIDRRFDPKEIPYMSLGALRFQPEQRHMMRERFGMKSLVTQAEMFSGPDGKMRYDLDLRSEMFKAILDRFHEKKRGWKVFLCMETPETWIQSYDNSPRRVAGLDPLFNPPPAELRSI
jgi:spore photoproduct lyase